MGSEMCIRDSPATVDTGNPPEADAIVNMGAYEYLAGDGDRNGTTDLLDYNRFADCVTGPDGGVSSDCIVFDLDADGDVDDRDFAVLQIAFTGEVRAPIVIGPFPINALQEVPPNTSPAEGTGSVTLSPDGFLHFNIVFDELMSAQTGAHFHGPAITGTNAGVQFSLPIGSPIIGIVGPLDAQQQSDLLDGLWYVNIHSALFPAGEIRGQVE